jgi:hypothetical protein
MRFIVPRCEGIASEFFYVLLYHELEIAAQRRTTTMPLQNLSRALDDSTDEYQAMAERDD